MPLTNSQYNELMRLYEERQAKNRDRMNLRYAQVYARVPELKQVSDQISLCSVEQAKKLLFGDSTALDTLRTRLRELAAQKSRLLSEGGYPADYLEPIYDCPDCQDTGYIGQQKCHCFQKAIIDLFYTRSHLRGVLERENFDSFSFDYYSVNYIDKLSGKTSRQLAEAAYESCRGFAEHFGQAGGNILLFGPTGCGKTFLTHCAAKEIMDQGFSVLYLTASEFVDAQTDNLLQRTDEGAGLCEQIADCDLLILDDLGTERGTEFAISQLFICLNERILNQKSTMISTNYNLDEIRGHYTERIFSRISNHYRILRLAGDDIRIQKKLMNREDI